MDKQMFIKTMNRELEPLKQAARQEILADFEEHFENGKSSGKTEQQVAEELGNPRELAAQYVAEAASDEKRGIQAGKVGRSIMAAFGLLLLDVMIIIPIVASLFAVVLSLWTIPLAVGFSAGALIFLPLFGMPLVVSYWLILVISIALLAFAVASFIGMIYLSKYFIKAVVKLAKAHYSVIVGG